MEKISGLYHDPRYSSHGATIENPDFQLTELQVLEENGVYEILKSLPSFDKVVDVDAKRKRKLQFNTRNTIPWKLECEWRGYDREYAIQSFKVSTSSTSEHILPALESINSSA